MSQDDDEPDLGPTYDVESSGYRRYYDSGRLDYSVERTPCPTCGGKGSYFYPNVTGGGGEVPCSCTQQGQRFWDNA
jgi:hypothetical protein